MNCVEHYLDEKLGMSKLGPCVKPLVPPADPRELLYYGVSTNNQGRASYLKARSKLPRQGYQREALTAAQEVGWHLGDPVNPLIPARQRLCAERPSMGII